jgi:hypothetical protein
MKGIVRVLRQVSVRCVVADGVSLAYLPQQPEVDPSFPARASIWWASVCGDGAVSSAVGPGKTTI